MIPGSGQYPGEGNGSPLQYSCLENPMDRGAWWATVHGVAKSRTRLSDFTFTSLSPPQRSSSKHSHAGHRVSTDEFERDTTQSVFSGNKGPSSLQTGGLEDKASACNAGDLGSIPGLGRSPGEGNGNLLQYSCLENPMDAGAWGATVHGVTKSRTRLSDFTFTFTHRPFMFNVVIDMVRFGSVVLSFFF